MSTTIYDFKTDLGPVSKRVARRRWRLGSLLFALLLPTVLVGTYLYGFADDQYVTEFRFNVHHEAPLRMDGMSPGTAMAASLSGGGTASPLAVITDSQIVVQYLKSRQVIDDMIAAGVDLDKIYAAEDQDFLAHLPPGSSIERRQRYWLRMVDPFFDMTTGIVSVQVRAFSPADARLVASTALRLAEKLVNDISNRAHSDVLSYARAEVADSGRKLEDAHATIADYRNQHAVLFPEMQATSDTALGSRVQETLIQAKTDYAAQRAQGVSTDTIQMRLLGSRIAAMQQALLGVNGHLAQSSATPEASLASILSRYDVLRQREEIAGKIYERALMALQDARNAASQKSVYLAAFVRPGLPQDSMYPIRWRVMLETALLSFVGWCLLQLLYHAIRDHID